MPSNTNIQHYDLDDTGQRYLKILSQTPLTFEAQPLLVKESYLGAVNDKLSPEKR
jgi:hypothetical protein